MDISEAWGRLRATQMLGAALASVMLLPVAWWNVATVGCVWSRDQLFSKCDIIRKECGKLFAFYLVPYSHKLGTQTDTYLKYFYGDLLDDWRTDKGN